MSTSLMHKSRATCILPSLESFDLNFIIHLFLSPSYHLVMASGSPKKRGNAYLRDISLIKICTCARCD
ncbi:Hypothetical predicted protein [Olea europaea subsp. europaea]|uniref:Uncharacterized protein n=1 Tax=Olea europaea subsp. europaea TaxID=158383 RepID=A0A8S0Q0D9_OLEEU|nr:Hypothetical predicted protein [Olea europaea subsp. europaea]